MKIILGTAHLESTPGKRSPDGKFREYAYSRRLCREIKARLLALGVDCVIDYEDDDMFIENKQCTDKNGAMTSLNSSQELYKRVEIVNNIYKKDKNCVYVSVHINAAGNGGWYNATGWCVFVSENASSKSKLLAECIHDAAADKKLKIRYQNKGVKYHTNNFYVCRKTLCPAVLTESMFQDNKKDVEWLESEEGFNTIVDLHVQGILKYLKTV